MSANDYYDSRPQRPQYQPYSKTSYNSYNSNNGNNNNYYNGNSNSTSNYGREEPYRRDADLPPLPTPGSKLPSYQSPVSPFEGPFDDHVYPARPQDSQNSFIQDSHYYGQGGGGRPFDSTNSFRDDIPLQDQGKGAKDNSTDQVYEVADMAHLPHRRGSDPPRNGLMRFFKMGNGRVSWVVYILTAIQVGVFIAEIVKNAQLTGSPIMIHPSFNPMIGPSSQVLINMGARYVSCMHNITGVTDANPPIQWPCPNTTTSDATDPDNDCTLAALCGFNADPATFDNGPDQWFRFITPIFLHAGIIHIGFNMLLQVTLGREMEKSIGPIRFLVVYMSSGIFGFVMGGNFAAAGIASTGASGALFGIIALTLLELLYTWKERTGPWKDLAFIGLDVVVSFVLGLLPGLDNFSHIGGFLMGLVLGICILHSPTALRKRIDQDTPPYTPVDLYKTADGANSGFTTFMKSPVGFFKGRKGLWWVWWVVRVAALLIVFIVFIVLLNNFYIFRKTCNWCKYLSCLPINNWCEIGNLQITNITNSKRSVFENWDQMAKLYEVAGAL